MKTKTRNLAHLKPLTAAILVALFQPTNAPAFLTKDGSDEMSHREITTAALNASNRTFSETARNLLIEYNLATDDAGRTITIDGSTLFDTPAAHCDSELIAACSWRVLEYMGNTKFALQKILKNQAFSKPINDIQTRLEYPHFYMGSALHTLQDFYAHTNWVNINGQTVSKIRDAKGNLSSERNISPNRDVVCESDRSTLIGRGLTQLTSGYYPFSTAGEGKCAHGGAELDDYNIPHYYADGMHKDWYINGTAATSETQRQHERAAGAAQEHSTLFINALLSTITDNSLLDILTNARRASTTTTDNDRQLLINFLTSPEKKLSVVADTNYAARNNLKTELSGLEANIANTSAKPTYKLYTGVDKITPKTILVAYNSFIADLMSAPSTSTGSTVIPSTGTTTIPSTGTTTIPDPSTGTPPIPDGDGLTNYVAGNENTFLTLGDGSIATSCTFTDVVQTDWYAEAVNAFCSAGILVGYSENGQRIFKPAQMANLVEVLKIIFFANDYKRVGELSPSSDPWYQFYLNEAAAKGLNLSNLTNDSQIVRRQVLTWIAKVFYSYTGSDPVAFLVSKNITSGTNLDGFVNRAEVVALAYRAAKDLGRYIHYGLVGSPPPALPVSGLGQAVAAKALDNVGEKYPFVDSKYTYCARFVREMFEKPAYFADAKSVCSFYDGKGLLHNADKSPPIGSAICYKPASSNGNYGHIAIATGNNEEVGATTIKDGVTKRSIYFGTGYQGWISPEDYNNNYPSSGSARRSLRTGSTNTTASQDDVCSKPVMQALYNSIIAHQTPGAVYLYSDAMANDSALTNAVASIAKEHNINIYPVVTDKCSSTVKTNAALTKLAQESGGQVFQVSQTGEELKAVLETQKAAITEDYEPLLIVKDSLTTGEKNYRVPVDSTLTDLIFTVSLTDTANIQIFDPNGQEITTTNSNITITSLQNGKIIQINQPQTGDWRLSAKGNGEILASVRGHSSIQIMDFKVVEFRGVPARGGLFPIMGLPTTSESTVSVNLLGSFSNAQLELRSEAGELLKTLDVSPNKSGEYNTKLTIPNQTSRVYLKGTDTNGKEFLRTYPSLISTKQIKITGVRADREALIGRAYKATLNVTNLGNNSDTFTLSAVNNANLPVSISSASITLAANTSATVDISIEIPTDTPVDMPLHLTVLAESSTNSENNNYLNLEREVRLDSDGDGISDKMEQGGEGFDPTYDGNKDGIPDYQQASVASLPTYDSHEYVTLVSPNGTPLSNVTATPPTEKLSTYPLGFFNYTVDGTQKTQPVVTIPDGKNYYDVVKIGENPMVINTTSIVEPPKITDIAQIAAGVHSCQDNSNQILLLDSNGKTVKTIDSSISGNGIDVTTTDWDLNKTIDFLVASDLFKGNNAFIFNTNGEKIAALPVSTLNKGVKVVFGKFENGAVAIVINQADDKKLYFYPNGKEPYSLEVLKNAADVNIVAADLDGDGIDEIIVLSAKQINGTNVLILDSKGKSKASLLLTLNGEQATTKLPGLVGTVFTDQGKPILALGNAEGSTHQIALYSFDKDFKANFVKNFTPLETTDNRRKNEKVTVCHNGKDLEIASSALPAHLGHGDTSGSCPTISPTPTDSTTTTTTDNSSNTTGTISDNSTTTNACNVEGEGLLLSSYMQDNKPVLLVAQNGSTEIKSFDVNGGLLRTLPLNLSNQAITSIAGINIDLTLPVLSALPPIGVPLKDVSVIGTPEKPLEVDNYDVEGRVHFDNTIIVNINIKINAKVTFGKNVRFKHKQAVPKGVDLSQIFSHIQQPVKKAKKVPAAINLNQSIVINAPTILQQIQAQVPTLQQDQATGNVSVDIGEQRFNVKPVKVKQGEGKKTKGFSVETTGKITFVTEEDHEVELIPAMEDTESLGTALEQEGIGNLEVTDAGQLSALLLANTSGGFYSGAPEMFSTPANDTTPEGLQPVDAPNLTQGNQLLRALIFKDKQGKKRKQVIYPQFAEPTSINGQLDLNGIAYFVVNGVIYRGRLDYGVIFGTNSRGSFNMQPKGDGNFIISYPSGKQQTFYPIK